MIHRPRPSTLFPYTTLFRSVTIVAEVVLDSGFWLERGRRHRPHFPFDALEIDKITHCHLSGDRKSTRLNSSHSQISYAVFCLKKKTPPATPLSSCRGRIT